MAANKKPRKVTLRDVELARGAYLTLKHTYEDQHPPKDAETPEERDARYAQQAAEHKAKCAAAPEPVVKTLYEPLPASKPGFLPEDIQKTIKRGAYRYQCAYGPWPLSWRLWFVWNAVKHVYATIKGVYHAK